MTQMTQKVQTGKTLVQYSRRKVIGGGILALAGLGAIRPSRVDEWWSKLESILSKRPVKLHDAGLAINTKWGLHVNMFVLVTHRYQPANTYLEMTNPCLELPTRDVSTYVGKIQISNDFPTEQEFNELQRRLKEYVNGIA